MSTRAVSLPTREEIPDEEYDRRRRAITDAMGDADLDVLLVLGTYHNPSYLLYVANFWPFDTGGAVVLPREGEPTAFTTDNTTQVASTSRVDDVRHVGYRSASLEELAAVLAANVEERAGVSRVGLVGETFVSNELRTALESALEAETVTNANRVIQTQMERKSEHELDLLRESAGIADEVLGETLRGDLVGKREFDVSAAAEARFGERDALPFGLGQQALTTGPVGEPNGHRWATDRTIQREDVVCLDLHALYRGYQADVARSVPLADAPHAQVELVDLAREAERVLIEEIRAGIPAAEVYDAASRFVESRGEDVNYRITPHPVGPFSISNPWLGSDSLIDGRIISPTADFDLEPNMVFATPVELERDGHRAFFENVVAVTDGGCELLNTLPMELDVA